MERFAHLLDSLIFTRSRNDKIDLIGDYMRTTPDPDRGWALGALTDSLDFPAVKSSIIRQVIADRVDPILFALSRDYVGDTAETIALLWPQPAEPKMAPSISEAVALMRAVTRLNVREEMAKLLDRLDEKGRFALLKLATGALRIGVSARLAKTALAAAFDVPVDDIDEVWHILKPPYQGLFDWLSGKSKRPDASNLPVFRPFMLAHPLEDDTLDLKHYAAEWKWDGIRAQLVCVRGQTRLYSRGGDDITPAFPDIADNFHFEGVLDGELLVRGCVQGGAAGGAASFNALQQRLGRKHVPAKMLKESPAFVRLYDVLFEGGEDLRTSPWTMRRARLETIVRGLSNDWFDVSDLIEANDFEALSAIRDSTRDAAIEGVMLKKRNSAYVSGRRIGLWYKWKRAPLVADCVLLYAQRGSGKRSGLYSDYTFGCWSAPPDDGGELVPVGKAYSGFTDEELKWIDGFVRKNTTNRFGPVREVTPALVFEVAFDSIHNSKRHKSGVAMRFPRIARIRKDKPANEADLVATLQKLVS